MKFDSINLNSIRQQLKNEFQLSFAYSVEFAIASPGLGGLDFSKVLSTTEWYPTNITINNYQIGGEDMVTQWYGEVARLIPVGLSSSIIELTFPFLKSMQPYRSFQDWITTISGLNYKFGLGKLGREPYQNYALDSMMRIQFRDNNGIRPRGRRIEYREVIPMSISKQMFGTAGNAENAMSVYTVSLMTSIPPNYV